MNASNPYGCNQYGHEWKGKHGEGWKPSGKVPEPKEGNEKSADKEAEDYVKLPKEKQNERIQRWRKDAKDARDKFYDIPRANTEEREKARAEANRINNRLREIMIRVAKLRGLSEKQTNFMLRLYPENPLNY